jgi:hypothetical protein
MVPEHDDVHARRKASPVGQAERHALVVVEDRDACHGFTMGPFRRTGNMSLDHSGERTR